MSALRPLTPRQEDRRRRILSAARAMVADHGYDGMVMSQVADAAGVSPTTLYNLYNTKDRLVMESLQDLLSENQRRVLASGQRPGWRLIMALVRNGARMANAEPAYAEAITYALLRATPGEALVATLLGATRDTIAASLDGMSAGGELAPGVDKDALATSIAGVYWSTFILWNKGLVNLKEIDRSLQLNCLSMLMAASRGAAREQLGAEYGKLLRDRGAGQ